MYCIFYESIIFNILSITTNLFQAKQTSLSHPSVFSNIRYLLARLYVEFSKSELYSTTHTKKTALKVENSHKKTVKAKA